MQKDRAWLTQEAFHAHCNRLVAFWSEQAAAAQQEGWGGMLETDAECFKCLLHACTQQIMCCPAMPDTSIYTYLYI